MEEERNFLYENDLHIVKKISQILRRLLLAFPMMLLFIMSGQFYLSYSHFAFIAVPMTAAVLLPAVLLKHHASLNLMKYVTVLAPTFAIGLLATEIHVVLYLCFGIGMALSLFYHDKKLTFWTAVYTYLIIVLSVGIRSLFVVNEPRFHYFLATIIGFLIEIIAMGFICMRIAEDSRDMLESLYSAKVQAMEAEKKARQSDALREEKRIAQQASRAKGVFLANMSHEIRTPINAVMGMNEMILRESKEPQILEYAGDIQRAGESLISIINDILDFSKIESGRLEVAEKPYRIQKMLTAVLQMVESRAKEKNLKLILAIDENLPTVLLGDEIRIRQILVNLLSNAVKYTKKGSITLTVTGRQEADTFLLCFGVRDTGIGIREEDMHRLFHMFERLDMKKNRDVEGTGLGLVITKKIVDAMNGTLDMESVYGEGSVFSVKIPQKVKNSEKIGTFTKEKLQDKKEGISYAVSFTAPTARVLIVDDNEMNLTVAKSLLKKTLVETVLCHSGQECLELTEKSRFDVILLDHMMPDLDGIETLHRLREMEGNPCRKVPVICMTANAMASMRERYLQEGFDDYISKPIHGRELEKILQSHIAPGKIQLPPEQGIRWKEPVGREYGKTIFNEEMGLTYSGGEKKLYGELLAMFASMYLTKRNLLGELYEQRNFKEYAVQVHALKSNAMTLGAEELSQKAKALELAAKAAAAGGEDAEKQMTFIVSNHGAAMALYNKAAVEAEKLSAQYAEA